VLKISKASCMKWRSKRTNSVLLIVILLL